MTSVSGPAPGSRARPMLATAGLVALTIVSILAADASADNHVVARLLYPQATPEPWEQDIWVCHLADSMGGDIGAGFVKTYQFDLTAVHSVEMLSREVQEAPASRDTFQDLYVDDEFVVQGALFTVSVDEPKYDVVINGASHGEWHYCVIYMNRSYPSSYDYRQIFVLYSNGFVRTKGLGLENDFKFGTSAVLGPYFYVPQDQSPAELVHPWVDTLNVAITPCVSFDLALTGGLSTGTSTPISAQWRIALASVDDYHSTWRVRQRVEVVEPVVLTELGSIGKVLCMAGMSSMWYSSSVFDSDILRVFDESGEVADSLFAWELHPPADPYTESEPMLIPLRGGVEMAKTYDDTHNPSSPDIRIFPLHEVEWSVDAEVSADMLQLAWAPIPIADSIYVFCDVVPHFVPDHLGHSNRVASLPGSATQYASPYGIGDPAVNAFYMLSAYGPPDGNLGCSGNLGELDYETGSQKHALVPSVHPIAHRGRNPSRSTHRVSVGER